jgi:hypothetical protein
MLGRLPNLLGFKITDRYLLWPVTKVKIDLSRRNASTQGRKIELVERYQHYAIAFFVQRLYYSCFSMHKGYITTNIQQAEHLHSIPPSFAVRGPSSLGVAYLFARAN